ncbi:MAG: mandelate racemase family protein [Candidatus Latescibacteria bacterium]|jgi:L-alanine-DL-glutamate epimerase-like enolase superfamily enzyme|nr:mandelate racemase family protein [Candidatus Latescibacterota bacterium]
MKITDCTTTVFKYRSKIVRDTDGHTHPGEEHDASQVLLTISTDEGAEGYCFGASPGVVERVIKPAIVGEDPFYRERIWQDLKHRQRLNLGTLSDRVLAAVDMALWDLAGRCLGQPVYKLLGGFRDEVPAYASTMCGDELEGGLDTPEAYGKFAEECKARGYTAFKLHTWQPPIAWAPDPKMDVAACRAVREAVGDDMALMLDPYHYYTREQALYLGRELEKLNYHWIEEPMDEHSVASYVHLTRELDIPVVGPETAEGKMYTRAEWILRNASDISRGGVGDLGGITPLVKTAHLCESFGIAMEVHGGGPGNLHVLCAMGAPGEYYERGLLHPFLDYDEPPPWLNTLPDPLDSEGNVHVSQAPGLGWDINWDYIRDNSDH